MIQVTIHEQACRGCQMCVDICPTQVFSYDTTALRATVSHTEDCFGCLSCSFICPSGAIAHEGHQPVRNFYHDLAFCGRMEKFL